MKEFSRKPSYFTCTLSEAHEYNQTVGVAIAHGTAQGIIYEHEAYSDISSFVRFLAKNYGQNLAVGCITPQQKHGDRYTEELLSAYAFYYLNDI
jgi:hypothetical protein